MRNTRTATAQQVMNKQNTTIQKTRAAAKTATYKGSQPQQTFKYSNPPSNAKPFTQDAELDSLIEDLYKNPRFDEIETDKLDHLCTYLREYAIHQGLKYEYDEAQKAHELSTRIYKVLVARSPTFEKSDGLTSEFQESQQQFEENWSKKFDDYDKETEEKFKSLKERLNKEKDNFEKQWNTEMPRKYRKPSTRLLQMKKIEKSFAVQGNYAKAKQIHLEIEKVATSEMNDNQKQLIHDYEVATRKFRQKQEDDVDNFNKTRQHWKNVMISQYETQKIALLNRDKVVKTRLNEPMKKKSTLLNPSVIYTASDRSTGQDEILLPPLKPPNDPKVKEEMMRKKREFAKKQQQYQTQNAEKTIQKYSIDPTSISRSDRNSKEPKVLITEVHGGIKVIDVQPQAKILPPELSNEEVKIGISDDNDEKKKGTDEKKKEVPSFLMENDHSYLS